MSDMVTGTVAGHEVPFLSSVRDYNPNPVALTVTFRVPVAYEDIVAVLWTSLCAGETVQEWTADHTRLHECLTSILFDCDSCDIAETRIHLADMSPDHEDHPALTALRALVADVYGTLPPAPRPVRRRATGRTVSTV
jgi:hypothetical protein